MGIVHQFRVSRFGTLIQNLLHKIRYPDVIYDYEEYLEQTNTYKKKALISYLCLPIIKGNKRIQFSNYGIARSIPKALNELGYSVDIIEMDNMNFIPKIKYDLFIANNMQNFRNIYNNINKDAVIIAFATENYWGFHNQQEEKRFKYLSKRHHITLPFDRHYNESESKEFDFGYSAANGIICLGDESVCVPFSKFPLVLNLNNASYQDNYYDVNKKMFENARNNFLFFGGGGNVHKGLDLLLDVFSRLDKNLYICTILEPGLEAVFKEQLKQPNIHYLGWVKQRSKKFYQLMNNCAFIIFPSCSEGSAGSVVECMNQGLIPIVSRETRIDVKDFGVLLNTCTIEEITAVVENISNKPISWLKEKSLLTRKAALTDYSEDAFIQNMKKHILKIINAVHERTLNKSETWSNKYNKA